MKHSDYYAQMIIGGGGSDSGGGGTPGQAATIQVGSTTTGEPGTQAQVTNSGTANAAVFDFVIPRGADGAPGADGADGAPGQAATIQVGQVTTGEPGTPASVTNSGTENAAIFDFVIPRGADGGGGGTPGQAATIQVGSTTTGEPGTEAQVTNSGTENAAVFDFVIPKGADGQRGGKRLRSTARPVETSGSYGDVSFYYRVMSNSISPSESEYVVGDEVYWEGDETTIYPVLFVQNQGGLWNIFLDNPYSIAGSDGQPGADGQPGQAATIQVGQVTTGEPGTPASVTNVGTETDAIFDFVIPKGDKGESASSGDGVVYKPYTISDDTEATYGTNCAIYSRYEENGDITWNQMNFGTASMGGSSATIKSGPASHAKQRVMLPEYSESIVNKAFAVCAEITWEFLSREFVGTFMMTGYWTDSETFVMMLREPISFEFDTTHIMLFVSTIKFTVTIDS